MKIIEASKTLTQPIPRLLNVIKPTWKVFRRQKRQHDFTKHLFQMDKDLFRKLNLNNQSLDSCVLTTNPNVLHLQLKLEVVKENWQICFFLLN